MLSLIRNVRIKESRQRNFCVSHLSSGDTFGESTVIYDISKPILETSVISETLSLCYRLDRDYIQKNPWDLETKTKLAIRSISFQDDTTLLRRHSEQNKIKMKSALFLGRCTNRVSESIQTTSELESVNPFRQPLNFDLLKFTIEFCH